MILFPECRRIPVILNVKHAGYQIAWGTRTSHKHVWFQGTGFAKFKTCGGFIPAFPPTPTPENTGGSEQNLEDIKSPVKELFQFYEEQVRPSSAAAPSPKTPNKCCRTKRELMNYSIFLSLVITPFYMKIVSMLERHDINGRDWVYRNKSTRWEQVA